MALSLYIYSTSKVDFKTAGTTCQSIPTWCMHKVGKHQMGSALQILRGKKVAKMDSEIPTM